MDILYEDSETASIKYVAFIGKSNTRFDLALINSDRFFGKLIVINILSGITALIGKDDLDEPDYLETAFKLNETEAVDLSEYLSNFI